MYPLELYVAAFDVTDLPPALYHYAPQENALELLVEGDHSARINDFATVPDKIHGAAGAIFITAVFERSAFKYGKRAYRFILLEAGHVAQNLMLTACSLDLATVAIGGFFDDEVNAFLGIDGDAEAALYIIPFGYRNPSAM